MTAMQQPEPAKHTPRTGFGTRRLRLAVAAVSIAAAAIGVALVFTRSDHGTTSTSSVAATLRVPGLPNAVAAGPDALWVASSYGPDRPVGTLVRIRLSTGAAQKTISIAGVPGSAVRVGDSLWVGHNGDWNDTKPGELTEIDWNSGQILSRLPFDRPIFGLASGAGSLWVVVGRAPATLVRIDLATKHVIGRPVPIDDNRVIGLAYGEGAVWATAFENGALIRFDTASGHVDRVRVGANPVGVVVSNGLAWVANRASGTVVRVDPKTLRLVGNPVHAGEYPTWIAAAGTSVWVSNQADGTVTRIDSSTGETSGSPIRIAGPANGDLPAANALAADRDVSLWVTSMTEQTVSRIDPSR